MATTGLSGTTFAQRAGSVAARTDQHVKNSEYRILCDFSGQSDLLASMSAEDLLAVAEANATARRAAGFDQIITTTVPSMTSAWNWTSPMETQRLAYNHLLKQSNKFDSVADIASLPQLQDPSNTTYFSDGLHMTPAGADISAQLIASLINLEEVSIL
jgi:hypothetical protein